MGVTTVIKDYGTDILNAIRENNVQKLRTILEKQLKADKKIAKLCTSDIKHKPTKKFACPLILAARQENPHIMKYMMDKGVDPNFIHHTIFSSKRREIVTALHISVDLGYYDTVQVLLDANADCNIGDHNMETPLHIAVKKADRIMTRMLLSKGADPSVPDRRGNGALHVATGYGHLQLVRTLLKYDADVYQRGQFGAIAPHIAAKEGHIHLIQLFCSRDVGNINNKISCFADKREKAPIHLAAEYGHVETVLALLDQFDAEVNLKDSDGNTPLHCCVLNQYNPHRMRDKDYFTETARVLIRFHISLNEKNVFGDTALHLASMNQFQRIVELLLQVGANPFVENEEHLKPIDVVPDYDPITKQVLKNAMLNPRSTLEIMPAGSRQNGLINTSTLSVDKQRMERSRSNLSFGSQSTVSYSSVFVDEVKGQGPRSRSSSQTDIQMPAEKPRKSPQIETHMYNEINQNVRTKAMKPNKQSVRQQTDKKYTTSTGTQHEFFPDEDDEESFLGGYDNTTQTIQSTTKDSSSMTQELNKILQKQRKGMKHYEEDSFSDEDSMSIRSQESLSLPEHMKKTRKPRPSPRMTPVKRGTDQADEEDRKSLLSFQEKPKPKQTIQGSRSEGNLLHRTQSSSSDHSRVMHINSNQGNQPVSQSIRVNTVPGRPGTIELQIGGEPITISVDTQGAYDVQSQYSQSDQHTYSTEQYPTDEYSEQASEMFSEHFSENVPGHYDSSYQQQYHQEPNESMDSTGIETSQHSMTSAGFQPEVVRNAIKEKVVEVTAPQVVTPTEKPKVVPRSAQYQYSQQHEQNKQQSQVYAVSPQPKKKKVPTATLR